MPAVTLSTQLIAHTQLSEDSPLRLALPAHVPQGQAVALTAIRTCYAHIKPTEIVSSEGAKYFGEPANDGEAGTEADRLIRHIMRSGHCYDDKTEVLTDSGFVLFKDLDPSMRVATVTPDGEFNDFTDEWKYIEHAEDAQEGFIYEHNSRDISFGVTSQHRMFYSPGRFLKKWKVATMQEIIDSDIKEYRMTRTPKRRIMSDRVSPYTNEELMLIGFFIGDGHAQSSSRVSFHLKKAWKIKFLEDLLKLMDIDYHASSSSTGSVRIRFTPDFFSPKDFYKDGHKTLNGLELLEGEEADSLLRGLMESDGSYTESNKTNHYCTVSPYLEEEVITLATINGIAAKADGFSRISLQKERGQAPFIKDTRKNRDPIKKVPYFGKTYCVSVPSGIIIVRRNKKVLVCGNTSTLEHLSYTFAVEGLSRAALAQLTRHRVGFSFSVQSQRFVKFGSGDKSGGFDYVVPESLKGERISVEDGAFSYTDLQLFAFDMERAQHVYDQLRNSGVPAEDARAVLPQAAACNLTMTVNLRSLLDFYAKRGPSTHAQSEIKALATQLKEAVIAVEPWTAQFFEEVAG